jgi:hypothetical protein
LAVWSPQKSRGREELVGRNLRVKRTPVLIPAYLSTFVLGLSW